MAVRNTKKKTVEVIIGFCNCLWFIKTNNECKISFGVILEECGTCEKEVYEERIRSIAPKDLTYSRRRSKRLRNTMSGSMIKNSEKTHFFQTSWKETICHIWRSKPSRLNDLGWLQEFFMLVFTVTAFAIILMSGNKRLLWRYKKNGKRNAKIWSRGGSRSVVLNQKYKLIVFVVCCMMMACAQNYAPSSSDRGLSTSSFPEISGHLVAGSGGRELVATVTVNTVDLLGAYNSAAVDDIRILNPGAVAYTGVSCTGTADGGAPTSLCMKKAVTIKCSTVAGPCTLDGLGARRVAIVESGNASIMKFESLVFKNGEAVSSKIQKQNTSAPPHTK